MERSLKPFYQAWRKAKQHKKPSMNQLAYEANWLDGLFELREQVQQHRWQPHRTVCFITTRPKTREIHAPDFADRVLHHYLVPQLQCLIEPLFIHDSFANRTGKGSHQAVFRLQKFMRQVKHSKTRPAYFLQLDIHNFFNSLDRRILYRQLCYQLDKSLARQKINPVTYRELRHLCHALVNQKPAENTYYRGSNETHALVPAHKQLKNARQGCGIAVGNLSSQFFANMFMNALDQWVKHQLKAKYYVRYVDDFVLLHEDPEQLMRWRQEIVVFLQKELNLRLKTNAQNQLPQPQPLSNGCDFLGYVIFPFYRLVRRRVIAHCREKLKKWQINALQTTATGQHILLSESSKKEIQGLVASYWGHFHHASHSHLSLKLFKEFFWLKWLFSFNLGFAPTKRWHMKTAHYFSEQIEFFQAQYPKAQLSVQKGYEQLSIRTKGEVNAFITITETGFCRSGLKRREVSKIFIPNTTATVSQSAFSTPTLCT